VKKRKLIKVVYGLLCFIGLVALGVYLLHVGDTVGEFFWGWLLFLLLFTGLGFYAFYITPVLAYRFFMYGAPISRKLFIVSGFLFSLLVIYWLAAAAKTSSLCYAKDTFKNTFTGKCVLACGRPWYYEQTDSCDIEELFTEDME